jgi:hypothetical protein
LFYSDSTLKLDLTMKSGDFTVDTLDSACFDPKNMGTVTTKKGFQWIDFKVATSLFRDSLIFIGSPWCFPLFHWFWTVLAAFPRLFPAGAAAKELIGRGQILQHQPLCGRIDGRGKDLPGITCFRSCWTTFDNSGNSM